MKMSEERVLEFKEIMEKEKGMEVTYEEAKEGADNLERFAELMFEIALKETQKKNRLKREPGGFPVDSNYSCRVCGTSINPETGWYDWYGSTCFPCKNALKTSVIPYFICENDDSYFSMWKLKYKFNLKVKDINKYIKEGKLVPRKILNDDGSVREQIFLKKENPIFVERYSPERKSYDRNREKVSKRWSREKAKEWKEEFGKKRKY